VPNIIDTVISYDRQREMDLDLNTNTMVTDKQHYIIGCGGIGYWVAINLAMLGAKYLVLVDGDRVETTNLNRIPAPPRMLGKFKVNALKAQLRLLRPSVKVVVLPCNITEDTFSMMGVLPTNNSVIWDCTDDARIQLKLYTWAKSLAKRYVKLGYEGWKIGMYRNMSMWIPDGYQPGYTTSSANVLSSSVIAALGIMYYCRNNQNDVNINLKDLVEGVKNE